MSFKCKIIRKDFYRGNNFETISLNLRILFHNEPEENYNTAKSF